MSQTPDQPQPSVNDRIAKFIKAVNAALADGGMGSDERENIISDLRVQVEEMLSARVTQSGKPTTLEDIEAVLAELDPPESYTEASAGKEPETTPEQVHGSCGPGHRRRGEPRWFWAKHRVAHAIRQAMGSFSPFGHPAFLGMTERARTAVSLAKAEAQKLHHEYIGTEHLLIGLALEGTGVAAKVLNDLGIDADWARDQTARLVGPGGSAVMHDRLPLTPRSQQAIRQARIEARKLGHDYLGTEHLLLGLVDDPDGVAAQVILHRGLTLQQVRAEIMKRIPSAPPPAASSPFTYWPASASQPVNVGGNEYKIIAGAADTGGTYAAVEAVLSSPDGLGPRTHSREDISIYVLDGSLKLRVETRTVDLAKGDFSRVGRGTPHEILPAGGPVRVMLIATPAGLEKMIPELAAASTTESLQAVAARFGVTTA
jgi:mannose-6-phosphate isomerase-like protein (cupin superfamily)